MRVSYALVDDSGRRKHVSHHEASRLTIDLNLHGVMEFVDQSPNLRFTTDCKISRHPKEATAGSASKASVI